MALFLFRLKHSVNSNLNIQIGFKLRCLPLCISSCIYITSSDFIFSTQSTLPYGIAVYRLDKQVDTNLDGPSITSLDDHFFVKAQKR